MTVRVETDTPRDVARAHERAARRAAWANRGPRVPFRWTRTDTWLFSVLGLLAAVSRFVGLGDVTDNGRPVFDEKHYVPQAWQILRSTEWSLSGWIGGGIENNPGYGLVVHPPVAKQVIAIGEWLFGYGPVGWRFMSAVFGVVVVLALMDITRRLTGNHLAVLAAGTIAVFDGVLFVSSRVGMLDMIQTGFIVAAFWALMIDRDSVARRLGAWSISPERTTESEKYGPRLPWRWWRFTAGILLGLALGVKWSGLYYMAAFGLWMVFADVADRRRCGVRKPVLASLGRDTLPGLWNLVAVPVGVYLLSWRSWFAQETSVYRHHREDQRNLEGIPFADRLPDVLQNYLHYQSGVLRFHGELTTSGGHEHPWESKPLDWLWMGRPMLYQTTTVTGESGEEEMRGWMMLFGTPFVWWLIVPVILWGLYRWVLRKDWRYSVPVVGFIASWVPWVIAYDRQMYFFYATALIPFVIIGLATILGDLGNWRRKRRRIGLALVTFYLALVIVAFFFWAPIMTSTVMSPDVWNLRFWIPSWS